MQPANAIVASVSLANTPLAARLRLNKVVECHVLKDSLACSKSLDIHGEDILRDQHSTEMDIYVIRRGWRSWRR
ncbi:hypothetical protein MHYP_G00279640 [Metynnis hypsauchen]